MRLPSLALVAAVSCSRRSPAPAPAPRPAVLAARVVDAGAAARPVVVAPGRSPEGPCALALPGGAEVVGLTGRIDRLQIAAWGDRARLVAELSGLGAPPHAATVSVDVTAAGVSAAPVTLTVGARDARVVATAVAAREGLRTVAFGVRRTGVEAADFGDAHRFVLDGASGAAVRSEQALLDVEELVAASEGDHVMAAASGSLIDCFGLRCISSDRQSVGLTYHPRDAFEVSVVLPVSGVLLRQPVARVDCPDPDGRGDAPTAVGERDDLPDRCRGVRRDRPYDVALAMHRAHAFVAFRTTNQVQGVPVTAEGVPLSGPQALSTIGEVGAPTVTWRGDAVIVVWAQRDNPRAPYSLRVIEWSRANTPQPPAPRLLVTGALPAFAPSLAMVGDRRVLAWMEGDDRGAAVRVSSTALGVEHLVDHAVTVSAPTAHARDPELAVAGERVWMAWSEYAAGQRRDLGNGRVRASPLRMP